MRTRDLGLAELVDGGHRGIDGASDDRRGVVRKLTIGHESGHQSVTWIERVR